MKKLITTLFLLFCSISYVYSAPAYGTKMSEKEQFYFGFQSYSVLERDLEGNFGEMSSQQYHGLVSYGLYEWLAIDLKVSMGNIIQRSDNGEKLNYDSPVWGGGYGFRVRLHEDEKFKSVFGFQHISIHPKGITANDLNHKAVLDDWQFSLLGSYNLKRLTPYAGVRYARMDYIHWIDDDRERVKSDENKRVGAILGVDVPLWDNMWLNVEGNFVDSQAVAASINFSF